MRFTFLERERHQGRLWVSLGELGTWLFVLLNYFRINAVGLNLSQLIGNRTLVSKSFLVTQRYQVFGWLINLGWQISDRIQLVKTWVAVALMTHLCYASRISSGGNIDDVTWRQSCSCQQLGSWGLIQGARAKVRHNHQSFSYVFWELSNKKISKNWSSGYHSYTVKYPNTWWWVVHAPTALQPHHIRKKPSILTWILSN